MSSQPTPKTYKDVQGAHWSTEMLSRCAITPRDVSMIRRTICPLGLTSQVEAEALFMLEARATEKCREWSEAFVELVTDFLVWGERPTGQLTEDRARWVIAQSDMIAPSAALPLLVNLIDEAQSVPNWFNNAVRQRALQVFAVQGLASSERAAA